MCEVEVLAVIPARGGSKGIPRKNLRLIAGKPLLGWTIEGARSARLVNRVVVSTDDVEIAAVARRYGAEVVDRPTQISGDRSSSESALLHALDQLHNEGYKPDVLVFLQCTSPLTAPEDIDGTIDALLSEQADSALAVTPFHYFLWRKKTDGDWDGINHDKRIRVRRQDLEVQYLETGAVYAMWVNGFRETKHRFFGKTTAYVTPPGRCCEIDEPADLVAAEALLRLRGRQQLRFRPDAVVFDFDGVFTDNSVWVDEGGKESVRCDRSDGMGIEMLKAVGIKLLILSKETNAVVGARSRKLGMMVFQGVGNKSEVLTRWAQESEVALEKVVYVGNDVNDLECMRLVGCPVAVADAQPEVLRAADVILLSSGGKGAVRELAEMILSSGNPPKTEL
jgi:YrbI family 3-deoxy-D-manno-octulosonate 8-phosphate phosphatase